MNIFVLDYDPKRCAELHCDKHVVKMISEYCQLIFTTLHVHYKDVDFDIMKPTHTNHPCRKWLDNSYTNYKWLTKLLDNLHDEWKLRYDHPESKVHKSYELYLNNKTKIDDMLFNVLPSSINDSLPVDWAYCVPEDCMKDGNIIESYRLYYKTHKQHILKYYRGTKDIPDFFIL